MATFSHPAADFRPHAPEPTRRRTDANIAAADSPLASEQLLQGRKAIEISHNGAIYRLQATRLGKLILTK